MTKAETTVIYRDLDGKAHEKSEDAARSNLMKRIMDAHKANPKRFVSEKAKDGEKKDPMLFLMELMIISHWVENNTDELEAWCRGFLDDCRADKAVIT